MRQRGAARAKVGATMDTHAEQHHSVGLIDAGSDMSAPTRRSSRHGFMGTLVANSICNNKEVRREMVEEITSETTLLALG